VGESEGESVGAVVEAELIWIGAVIVGSRLEVGSGVGLKLQAKDRNTTKQTQEKMNRRMSYLQDEVHHSEFFRSHNCRYANEGEGEY
jgi:hypothetical protein